MALPKSCHTVSGRGRAARRRSHNSAASRIRSRFAPRWRGGRGRRQGSAVPNDGDTGTAKPICGPGARRSGGGPCPPRNTRGESSRPGAGGSCIRSKEIRSLTHSPAGKKMDRASPATVHNDSFGSLNLQTMPSPERGPWSALQACSPSTRRLHAIVQKTVQRESLQKQQRSQHALMVSFSAESFWSPQRKHYDGDIFGPMPPPTLCLLSTAPRPTHIPLPSAQYNLGCRVTSPTGD